MNDEEFENPLADLTPEEQDEIIESTEEEETE